MKSKKKLLKRLKSQFSKFKMIHLFSLKLRLINLYLSELLIIIMRIWASIKVLVRVKRQNRIGQRRNLKKGRKLKLKNQLLLLWNVLDLLKLKNQLVEVVYLERLRRFSWQKLKWKILQFKPNKDVEQLTQTMLLNMNIMKNMTTKLKQIIQKRQMKMHTKWCKRDFPTYEI